MKWMIEGKSFSLLVLKANREKLQHIFSYYMETAKHDAVLGECIFINYV
jgi:hypothetical protein